MAKQMTGMAAVLAVWLGWMGTALAVESGIVFIDLDKAFTDYHKTKLADAQLKDQADAFNEQRKKKVAAFEAMQEEFNQVRDEAANDALAEEVRIKKRRAAEDKLADLQDEENNIRRFDESRRKQLQEQGQRMRKRIVDEIRTLVEKYAKDKGYRAVIDISGQSLNGVPIVLYVDPGADITADILEILNRTKQ